MQQSKRHSLYETITSTTVGFIVAFLLNLWILPWFMKVTPTHSQNFGMVVVFTIVSVIRGYGMRRFFNWLGWKKRATISYLLEKDQKFLLWLRDMLVFVHNTDPRQEYIQRLEKLAKNQESQ